MKCLRGWLILCYLPLWRREDGLPSHKCSCSSQAPRSCLELPPRSSWMPRSLLDVLLVSAPTAEGSLWPNWWIGRYQNPGERFISWIYTSKVQRPMLRHCYAVLLQLTFKHITWQFWHTPLSSLSDGTRTWLGGQHGAGNHFSKGSFRSWLFHGGRKKCSSVMQAGTRFGLRTQRTISGLFYELIEVDPFWSRYQNFLL